MSDARAGRAVAVVRRAARAEWGPIARTVRSALAARRLRAVPLTLTAVTLTLFFHFVQSQSWGLRLVGCIGWVQAAERLWVTLLRTPLSLFVPALDLPVWGALAQVLVVFGVAEICLGRRQTLLVAYAATLAGTLYARFCLWLGSGPPFGLPDADRYVIDSGPSAAVVGLAVAVCWRYRARFTCVGVVVAMVVEVAFIKNNLAGKEHVAAVALVLALCLAGDRWWPRKPRDPQRVRGRDRPE
ncbi:hypothetical protein MUU72_10705 [Streptomyces sp. RS10V-4]|uniref:hypothetical protein n=1 Tax=Streptomyces rhizoryzae TaxID=2932493 RepID=UPI00200497E1|nr:hypothetical protein [Streptomyces rhizoryzae]MCK7623557.1 hypothetical protein [Streptomyces rhizoryzae]